MKTFIFQPSVKKYIFGGHLFFNLPIYLREKKRAAYRLIILLFIGFFIQLNVCKAFPTNPFVVTLSTLDEGEILLNKGWKFHPGDDFSWAQSNFDDSFWARVDPTTDIHYLTALREAEIGWFRLHFDVDESLMNVPLALTIFQRGASEIYLNGKLIHSLGVVSHDPNEEKIYNPNNTPYSFQFEDSHHQVLAVRYSFTKSNPYMNFLGLWGGNPTLVMRLNQMDKAINKMVHSKAEVTSRLVGKATFLLFLALLHLFFFITYPSNKTNLHYSLFTISLALGYFLEHVFRFMPRAGDSYFIIGLMSSLFFSTFIIWGILAVYSFAKEKLDGLFWFATASALLYIPTWKLPYEAANYYWPYYLIMGPFIAVLISWRAVTKNIKGAYVIFFGWLGNLIFWTLFCLFHSNVLPRYPHDIAITLDLAIFCASISFSILLAMEYAQTKRSLQTSLLEVEVKRLEAEKMLELDKTKSDFFANISHEFRTPLTLISGTLNQLEIERKNFLMLQEAHGLIKKSADRLLQLVNQLLDLSRLESGKLKLEQEPHELTQFLKRIAGTFASHFESKAISFEVDIPNEPYYVAMDQDKLEKIVSNLLINASKFTPTGGKVNFCSSVEVVDEAVIYLEIKVMDNGIGIGPEVLPHIFERFYQSDATATKSYEGTGIGLALVKELIELHGGRISVESTPGLGTQFIVNLSLKKLDQEALNGFEKQEDASFLNGVLTFDFDPQPTENLDQTHSSAASILIVEDNEDLRKYISDSLYDNYQIFEAENGAEGYKMAIEMIPDIIISDVMMPVLDGICLSEKVKNDERTSHVPLILLTARADSDSKINGLETGADAYLTKPFEMKELKVRINHLIEGRRKIREKFGRLLKLQPSNIMVSSIDEKFLNKALTILEENIMNTDFNVEFFSREIGMSRTNLHRKLKALTDHSATEFIRIYRLKRAKCLLEHKAGNISEVAYAVGFTSVGYFTKCFKNQYGQTPSEFNHGSVLG